MSKVLPYTWESKAPTCAHNYILKPILSFLSQGEQLKIADLGCGNGYLASVLAASLGPKVTALDSSEDGIRIAQRAYAVVTFHCCSLYENIPAIIGTNDGRHG